MARYIDLEEFAKRINENIKPDTPEEKALIEWCKDECIRQGYAMPTADAAPKSEVEKYKKAAIIAEEEYQKVLNHYLFDTTTGNGTPLQRARAEVAREVISEFKTLVKIRMIELGIYPVALARTLELVEKKLTEKYKDVYNEKKN